MRRFRGIELLDGHGIDAEAQLSAMRDLARANAYLGGTRAVLSELWAALGPSHSGTLSVLDVGSGTGDIALQARVEARKRGVRLETLCIDVSSVAAIAATQAGNPTATGDARELPFPARSFDIVVCSQLLHHFCDDEALQVLRELDRVARRRVIVSDLRRSSVAALGFRLAASVLRFHPVSRHDGVVSVLRGFRESELADLVRTAVGVEPYVRRRFGFRLTASWAPVYKRPRVRGRPRPGRPGAHDRESTANTRALAG